MDIFGDRIYRHLSVNPYGKSPIDAVFHVAALILIKALVKQSFKGVAEISRNLGKSNAESRISRANKIRLFDIAFSGRRCVRRPSFTSLLSITNALPILKFHCLLRTAVPTLYKILENLSSSTHSANTPQDSSRLEKRG